MSDNGQWTIGHYGGAAFGEFNNGMLLLPDQNLGVFFIYNSELLLKRIRLAVPITPMKCK